jgi:hypothetical protein
MANSARTAVFLSLLLLGAPVLAQPPDPRAQPKVPAPGAAPPAPAASPTPPAPAPTAPGASSSPPATPATGAAPQTDPGVGETQIRSLEEQVNDLKERIFRSKARLILLQEAVLSGQVSGAYAVLYHKNTMGSAFKLEQATYHLDGSPIYSPSDPSELEKKREFPVFQGAIVPGNHTISVYLVYRGASALFPYWQGYQFKIKSSYTFHFEVGKITSIKVVGFEKGGVTTDMKDRPSVRFDVDVQKMTKGSTPRTPEAGTK